MPTHDQWYQLSQSSQQIEGWTLSTDFLQVGHCHWFEWVVASYLCSATIGDVDRVLALTTGLGGPGRLRDCFFFLHRVHIQLESAFGSVRMPTHCQWYHWSHLSHWIIGVPSSGFSHCGQIYSSSSSSISSASICFGFSLGLCLESLKSSSELILLSFFVSKTMPEDVESFRGRPLGLIGGGLFDAGIGFDSFFGIIDECVGYRTTDNRLKQIKQ